MYIYIFILFEYDFKNKASQKGGLNYLNLVFIYLSFTVQKIGITLFILSLSYP